MLKDFHRCKLHPFHSLRPKQLKTFLPSGSLGVLLAEGDWEAGLGWLEPPSGLEVRTPAPLLVGGMASVKLRVLPMATQPQWFSLAGGRALQPRAWLISTGEGEC